LPSGYGINYGKNTGLIIFATFYPAQDNAIFQKKIDRHRRY